MTLTANTIGVALATEFTKSEVLASARDIGLARVFAGYPECQSTTKASPIERLLY